MNEPFPYDAAVIKRVLNGERNAFAELVTKYSAGLFRVCMSLCRDPYLAEEAMQEAFIDAYLQLKSLSEPERFGGWLTTIARRKCFRLVTTRTSVEDIDELDELLEGEGSPEDSVVEAERRRDVRRAIERLSPTLRRTIEQFYLEGRSVREIASREQIPEATVKSRLFDGRNKLRKELAHMNEYKIPENLESKILAKLAECENYYALHAGFDDSYRQNVGETVGMIEQLSDEKRRQSLLATALQYQSRADEENRDELLKKSLELAELADNLDVIVDNLIDKCFEHFNKSYKNGIEFLDSEALPKLSGYLATPEGLSSDGKLRFWRGRANIGLGDVDAAIADFELAVERIEKRDSYYANAVAALSQARDYKARGLKVKDGFAATAEGLLVDGNRLVFANQPGFGGGLWTEKYKAAYDSIDYFASRCRRTFFDSSMKVGDVLADERDGTTLTVVADDETISVPAGEFASCLHTRVDDKDNGVFDVWYAKNVGIVRFEVNGRISCETYELTSYDVKGEGWYPLALGNRWSYANPATPEWIYQRHEKRVEYFDGRLANLSCADSFTLAADYREKIVNDSDGCLAVADLLSDEWKVDDALELLRAGVRANSSERAVKLSLRAIDTFGRFSDYLKKGYRICPSSVGATGITVADGVVKNTQKNGFGYSFGPYRLGRRGRYEDRIFGMKPFRFQQFLFGCLWDDEWGVGYRKEGKIGSGDGEISTLLTVEDGGRVETPAGVFENCRLVTITAELPGGDERYYFRNGYSFMHCGVKRYWYAPGVGIVKIVSDWGSTCHSETQLMSYANPAASSDDYFPVHLGAKWEWAETECEKDGYHARFIAEVASGIGGEYCVTQAQEFVWLGVEEEYNKLPQSF